MNPDSKFETMAMLCGTLVYGTAVIVGRPGIDAVFVLSSLAVVCGWLPRALCASLAEVSQPFMERFLASLEAGPDRMPSKEEIKLNNLIFQASLVTSIMLFVAAMFDTDMRTGITETEWTFAAGTKVCLVFGGIFACVMGAAESLIRWNRRKLVWELGGALEAVGRHVRDASHMHESTDQGSGRN